jgi:hypothetical protein
MDDYEEEGGIDEPFAIVGGVTNDSLEVTLTSVSDSPQANYSMPSSRRPKNVPLMAIPATRMGTKKDSSGARTVEIPTMEDAGFGRLQTSKSQTGKWLPSKVD